MKTEQEQPKMMWERGFKSMRPTLNLRWRKPNENEIIALMEGPLGKYHPVLQQMWINEYGGPEEWRDIPYPKE